MIIKQGHISDNAFSVDDERKCYERKLKFIELKLYELKKMGIFEKLSHIET